MRVNIWTPLNGEWISSAQEIGAEPIDEDWIEKWQSQSEARAVGLFDLEAVTGQVLRSRRFRQ
jgi:hypothetical protein